LLSAADEVIFDGMRTLLYTLSYLALLVSTPARASAEVASPGPSVPIEKYIDSSLKPITEDIREIRSDVKDLRAEWSWFYKTVIGLLSALIVTIIGAVWAGVKYLSKHAASGGLMFPTPGAADEKFREEIRRIVRDELSKQGA